MEDPIPWSYRIFRITLNAQLTKRNIMNKFHSLVERCEPGVIGKAVRTNQLHSS